MTENLDRIFVSIAVSNPDGGLVRLPGAISASERMAKWATKNGYIPILINDNIHSEVTIEILRSKIFDAITEVTNRTSLSRLVIFFAGHGAVSGVDDQSWLLSNWDRRPSEVIKVSALQRMLEFYGPKQVTIIGDACQEFAARFIDIVGGPILDKTDETRKAFELDRFFPVDAGSQAFMIKANGEEKAFCLFTEIMLDALEGDAADEYFENYEGGRHVTSQTIAQYLLDNLAKEAGKYGVTMDPRPRPGFYSDRVYYTDPPPYLAPGGPTRPTGRKFATRGSRAGAQPRPRSVARVQLTDSGSVPGEAKMAVTALAAQRKAMETDYAAARRGDARSSFETGCGICFTGADVSTVQASHGNLSQGGLPTNWYRIDLSDMHDPELSTDVLVDLADGNVASACVVQNFVTTMHVYKGGGINVLHRPLGAEASEGNSAIDLLSRMQAGSLGEREIINEAAALRMGKHRVLTWGAIVAQFYDSIRDTASLCSIAAYYAIKKQPIPIDVVLFGGGKLFFRDEHLFADISATEERRPRSAVERGYGFTFEATHEVKQHPVAGRVPWMRQAWSAIETVECDESAEPWRELALAAVPHIGPGPFSVVKAEGRAALLALAGVTADRESPQSLVASL